MHSGEEPLVLPVPLVAVQLATGLCFPPPRRLGAIVRCHILRQADIRSAKHSGQIRRDEDCYQ